MSESRFCTREEANLSVAWARAFLGLLGHPAKEYTPFIVSIAGLHGHDPEADEELRQALDGCLEASGYNEVQTVANTIFPQSMWRRAKGDRRTLFEQYREDLPSFVEMDERNRNGTYFSRLIGFWLNPKDGSVLPHSSKVLSREGNQLEFIIQECKPRTRRTKFQAAIFDPMRDVGRSAQQGFPCLQHVTFVPDFEQKSLAVNAFYATQQLFTKAYGNWLGLCRLGAFIAGEVGLAFDRLTCFVGVEKMDQRPRSSAALKKLRARADAVVQAAAPPEPTVVVVTE